MKETEATELDQPESDDLVRAKRSQPIYLNQAIYTYPANPYYFAVQPAVTGPALVPQASKSSQEQQSLLYQPQYFYLGLPVATAKSGKQFPASPIQPTYFNQPSYSIPYVAPGQAVRSDSEVPVTEKPATDEDETATNFPYVPPGAIVAEEPLPENTFPIFPYDPEQDNPAAVQF